MLLIRKILFLTFIISISFSSVANAAMQCCNMLENKETMSMHMDEPCHGESKNETKNTDDSCASCDCQHCISKVFLISPIKEGSKVSKAIQDNLSLALISHFPDQNITPPKHIS